MARAVEKPKAVVLLSGGMDSSTCLAWARKQGFACFALTVNYGQRHQAELDAAGRMARALGAEKHLVIDLDLRGMGGSALTSSLEVPKGRNPEEMNQDIPVTYVPARNTIFLSLALGWAEALDACDLVIGVNALDYSGYPDCRPQFIAAFADLARLATKAGAQDGASFKIHTPLIDLTKAQIVALGQDLGVDFSLTHTCYDPTPEGLACGRCDACLLRLKGFAQAGAKDPVPYV